MSDAPSPPAMSPDAARSAESAAPVTDLLTLRVNAAAVVLCVVLTFAGVKLSQFLPAELYFSFARAVSAESTPFLIQPAHISRQEVCEVLGASDQLKLLKCDAEEEADEPGEEEGLSQEELRKREAEKQRVYEKQIAAEQKIAKALVDARVRQGGFLMEIGAVLVRLAIPLIAGFLVGRLFAAEGIASAGFGGALAALLFCWPVIVLWDRVVTHEWQDEYPKFIALYIVYIGLFFFVARLGAIVGARAAPGQWSVPINFQKITETVIGAIITGLAVKVIERAILS